MGDRCFIVYDYIVTEKEIVALHATGKVTPENAANLLRELEQRIETQLDSKLGAAQGRARYWNRP